MKANLPRDAAVRFDLTAGTGAILAMCPLGDVIEIYKEDTTFRIQSPEAIDPDRTNPNAPHAVACCRNVGASNSVVARVLLQGKEILERALFTKEIDREAIIKQLHACKELLVVCYQVAQRVVTKIDEIIDEIGPSGIKAVSGGRVLDLPSVPDLERDTTQFLIHAKRAIAVICRMPSLFLPVPAKDTNFKELAKTLSKVLGAPIPVIEFISTSASRVKHLIDLRNYQEHPIGKKTIVQNFSVTPTNSIVPPIWYIWGQNPRPIRDDIVGAVDFLIETAEMMLIHLVREKLDMRYPFTIVAHETVDPKIPIRYQLSLDPSHIRAG